MIESRDILSHFEKDCPFELLLLSETDSTNLYAKRLCESGKRGYFAVHAEHQTSGRGRREREFVSPQGSGIYLSLCFDAPLRAELSGLITVYTAVAVRAAILEVCGKACGIKWVNDLYLEGKKVCGILTEGRVNYERRCFDWFVVGIGINVTPPKDGFTGAARDVAGAICEQTADPDGLRGHLIAGILKRMQHLPDELEAREYLADYRSHNLIPGRRVTVHPTVIGQGGSYEADAIEIDGDGQLVVMTQDGERRRLFAGEVSCKLK